MEESPNDSLIKGFDSEKDDSLSFTLKNESIAPNVLFVYLSGYLATNNAAFFQRKVQKILDSGVIKLIFNLQDLSYISSSGVGSFTFILKTLKEKGGDVVLSQAKESVTEVFQLLGLKDFFTIKNTTQEAIDYFNCTGESAIFPKILDCPACKTPLRVEKEGRYRCNKCQVIITVSSSGQAVLG